MSQPNWYHPGRSEHELPRRVQALWSFKELIQTFGNCVFNFFEVCPVLPGLVCCLLPTKITFSIELNGSAMSIKSYFMIRMVNETDTDNVPLSDHKRRQIPPREPVQAPPDLNEVERVLASSD